MSCICQFRAIPKLQMATMRSMPRADRWIDEYLLCGANSPESFVHLIGVSDLPSDLIIGAPIVVTLDYMRLMTVWAPPNCWTVRGRWSLIRHAPTFNVFIRRGYTTLMDGKHSLRRQSLIIAHYANCCLGISLVLHNKAPRKTTPKPKRRLYVCAFTHGLLCLNVKWFSFQK